MKPRLHDVFERLDPPPGGPARLRARLTAAAGPRESPPLRPLAWIAAAATAASLAGVLLLAALERPATRSTPGPAGAGPATMVAAAASVPLPGTHPALATLGLEPLPTEPVTAAAGANSLALQRVPVADDRVVFYLAAELATEPTVPAGP